MTDEVGMDEERPSAFETHVKEAKAALAKLQHKWPDHPETLGRTAQTHAILALAHATKSAGVLSAIGGGLGGLGALLAGSSHTPPAAPSGPLGFASRDDKKR